MKDINPFSYKYIQNSIRNFRSLRGDNFNWYDEPGTYWFKPIFYFYRSTVDSEASDINNEGLLHPSWLKNSTGDGYISDFPQGRSDEQRKAILEKKFVSSAYNYLMRNDEEGRAELLKQFITLLSNIVSRSPWYFQEVAGLDTAIDHAEAFKDGKFVSDDRKQITFTLLPDAIDDRIGTLIDLYRSICYSWKEKKEIVPANLRKFDMGLYVHGSMIQNDASDILFSKLALSGGLNLANQLGVGYDPKTEIVNASGKYYYRNGQGTGSAHAYFEFINCEIDLSSTKGGDTISNAEGSERKYTLTISYDDCYINRYNSFIQGAIGDVITTDLRLRGYGQSIDAVIGRKPTEGILNKILGNIEGATLGQAKQAISQTVGDILLGNLYSVSAANTFRDVTSGRIVSTGVNELNKVLTGNKDIETGENIYQPLPAKKAAVKTLGNLYRSVGIAANL